MKLKVTKKKIDLHKVVTDLDISVEGNHAKTEEGTDTSRQTHHSNNLTQNRSFIKVVLTMGYSCIIIK